MGDKGLWIDHIVFPLEKYKLYKIKINKSRGKGNLYWIKKRTKTSESQYKSSWRQNNTRKKVTLNDLKAIFCLYVLSGIYLDQKNLKSVVVSFFQNNYSYT